MHVIDDTNAETFESPGVHAYILTQRKIDPSFFGGLDDFCMTMQTGQDGACLFEQVQGQQEAALGGRKWMLLP